MLLAVFCLFPLVLGDTRLNDDSGVIHIDFQMPQAKSSRPDDLVCHSLPLDKTKHQYILEYIPKASSKIAHHMMIYGCKHPGSYQSKWKCGGMERSELDVCEQGAMERRIVYAWALDAPSKKLPKGVGLRVGGDTDIQYLVLQLHYKEAFQDDQYDESGVILKTTYKRQKLQLGFYILGNWGFIPPQQQAFHMESACQWNRNDTIYPFAYRTHAHQLGRVTSAYRIRDGSWTEIGRMSPQQPEMFYNVSNPGMAITYGDILAARCTMNSMKRLDETAIGARNVDEMCNFYFMYYTDREDNLQDEYCFRDAQTFHWKDHLHDIPNDVSSLVGVHLLEPSMEPNDQAFM